MMGAGLVVSPTRRAIEKLVGDPLMGDDDEIVNDGGGVTGSWRTPGAVCGLHSSSVMLSDECELEALFGRDFLRFSKDKVRILQRCYVRN
jgi:hypothetical protein